MNETERNQIKGALLKCAEENENKPTFTGCVVVSSVCISAVERIEELEGQIEKMKCDVLSLIKDRMNDDIDQNIIERLAEKWEAKEND